MTDSADDLIRKMQHLGAQARLSKEARDQAEAGGKLKTAAQRVANDARREVARLEKEEADGEAMLERAVTPGLPPLEAGDLVKRGRVLRDDARSALVKARAKLSFALDKLSESERHEYEAFQKEVAAETHGHLVDET